MSNHALTPQYKTIHLFLFILIAISLLGIPKRATAKSDIPEKFDVFWSGAPDAYEKFKSCIPFASEQTFKSNVLNIPGNSLSKTYHPDPAKGANYVLAQGDKFICVHTSDRHKALIPTSFFKGTISFGSLPDAVRDELYMDIAQQLARHGFAQALIVMKNGSATSISFMNDATLPSRLYYNISFLKADEYKEADFKPVYHIPDSPISISSYDNQGNSKSLIHGTLSPRPINNEFLVIKGTSRTAAFSFAGSKWELKDDAAIEFGNDGKLTYKPKKGAEIEGEWKIENDALYFHYGKVHISSVLNDQGDALVSEGRSLFPPQILPDGVNNEIRWKPILTRSNP